jgi:hypothetical protein
MPRAGAVHLIIPDAPRHAVMRRRSGISAARDTSGEIPCLRCTPRAVTHGCPVEKGWTKSMVLILL